MIVLGTNVIVSASQITIGTNISAGKMIITTTTNAIVSISKMIITTGTTMIVISESAPAASTPRTS